MIVINGEQGNVVHAMDRAYMYGDGVFRTMRIRHGKVLNWSQQYRKLHADCQSLDILCPSIQTLENEWRQLARDTRDCVLKIIVTRGEGGRGYSVPAKVSPNRVLLTAPLPEYPASFWHEGVKLHLCDLRVSHQPRLAGIKHLNRLENVLARMEWDDETIPDGLMLDAEGWVVEGTMSNIFMRSGQRLLTPDLSQCGVAGLQRERILEQAPSLGLSPEITLINLSTLLQADEIFVCNSVIGAWPVRQIGANTIPLGPCATQVQAILERNLD